LLEYRGIKEVQLSQQDLANFYEGDFKFDDMVENQYLLIKDESGNYVDKCRFDGKTLNRIVKPKFIESRMLDKVKALNIRQEIYIDLLHQKDITIKCVQGSAGAGKSFIAIAYSLQELEKDRSKKLYILRNNVPIEGVEELGFLPGTEYDKLKPYIMYASDVLSEGGLQMMVETGRIEMLYLGTLRGRNLSNAIVLCSESQNMTVEHLAMIISRMGKDTISIFDFDMDQVDKKIFRTNNGMKKMYEVFPGEKLFGCCELEEVERSESAKLARKLLNK